MDERKEDDDGAGDGGGSGGDDLSSIALSDAYHRQRKLQSYSQPLGRDAVPAASRRGSIRNHYLDEVLVNPFYIDPASGDVRNAGRTLSDPHYYPSQPPWSHQKLSNSVEDIQFQHPNLPPPLPPYHHAVGVSLGSAIPFPVDRRSGSANSSFSESDGTLTLERAMSEFGGAPGSIPEFMGTGGGTGIFRVPICAAMHPSRPPALELRPHPLRETQAGSFLRTIVCTSTQLWAGQESGLRFWNLSDVFDSWNGRPAKRGDEESAPFYESERTSPVLCLVADEASGFVWSGHKDGKIRSWRIPKQGEVEEDGRMEANTVGAGTGFPGSLFREGLSWQAHRTPVLSMTITSYGDIWTGSEGGALKAWPWESIEKSLSLTLEERHMATLLVARSYVDLRSQVTVNAVCSLPAVDIKFLLSDNSRSKVWSGGSIVFALWDSRKRELLKVFNIDGQVENRVEIAQAQENYMEDEMKVKLTKKEKSGSISFFQRSRNALIGAADAVRRVAQKGTFAEDNRRTEALAITMDGMIWTGCSNGSLVQWDGNGNRQFEVLHHSFAVKSICAFGTHLWVGYVNGNIQVLDLEGYLLGGWIAHSGPLIKMDVGASYIFSLASHGGIRGWSLASPGPIDDILRMELSSKELLYTKLENVKILGGTWNVGQERASHDSLISWLGTAATEVGLVVVGLQEVEMGAGFLAMAAAKETVGLEGSANGQWWLDAIGKTLDEGTSFERVGSRQLAGLLIAAWVRKSLRPNVGDVDAAAVACGFGRAIGNKGAVGLRMRVFDRVICFVSCHFAAHLEAVSKRNADFNHVYRNLSFTRPSVEQNSGSVATSVQVHRGGNSVASQYDEKPDLSEADMVVFLGDFNYRLFGVSYDEARDMVSQRCFDWLREKDQLRAEMKAGKVFQGMREAQIKFPPTYKYERHQAGLSAYDASEKKRIPAWCDRILYRDSRSISVAECSLECPVVSSISLYESCMDVTDSDHKPVRCIFSVEIAHVDRIVRRQAFGEILASHEKLRSLVEEYSIVPDTIVSTNNIILQNQDTSILRITNKCEMQMACYEIICEGQFTVKGDGSVSELCAKGSFGFPNWLQIQPATGIIGPGQILEVTVHHEDFYTQEEFVDGIPHNWWCEDTRDKEVVLLVKVRGSYSTEARYHQVHVRHCYSNKDPQNDSKGGFERLQSDQNHLQRTDFASFGSSDVVNLCHMRCP